MFPDGLEIFNSPIGDIEIAALNDMLISCTFSGLYATETIQPNPITREGVNQLKAYFVGKLKKFDLPNILDEDSEFIPLLSPEDEEQMNAESLPEVLPILPLAATRERQTKFWVGDTWKALWTLLEYRPDLTINVIPTAPSGIAVIRGFGTCRALTETQLAGAVEKYSNLPYPDYEAGSFPAHLPLVANSVQGWLMALGLGEETQ